jgi:hypothetical protein
MVASPAPRREFPVLEKNSLFRPKNSLFREKNSLFFLAQGICLQGTEIAARIGAESAGIAVFARIFSKFPVKFPVLREFEGSRPQAGPLDRI